MSSEELRSRCAAALRKWYRGPVPHVGMDGESFLEAMLGTGRHIEIVDDPAERIWLWSDLHLWDPAAHRLSRRPGENVRVLSRRMLDEWERTVDAGDLVLCLGDVAHVFGLTDLDLTARLRAAPGRRLLVLGNHDVHRGKMLEAAGFERMCVAAVRAGEPPLVFSHLPLVPPPAGAVNVHGHLHRRDPPSPQHWNVSVDRIGYRPVRLDRLIEQNGTVR